MFISVFYYSNGVKQTRLYDKEISKHYGTTIFL